MQQRENMALDELFGHGKDLTALQMAARAFVLFFVTLAFVRIAGMRAFGRKSSFDTIIVITLGAVLSRVIVGASPAWPTLAACAVLVILDRTIAMLTSRSELVDRLVKGRHVAVFHDGGYDERALHHAGISPRDIKQAVRKHTLHDGLDHIREVDLESSGELTIIEKPSPKA